MDIGLCIVWVHRKNNGSFTSNPINKIEHKTELQLLLERYTAIIYTVLSYGNAELVREPFTARRFCTKMHCLLKPVVAPYALYGSSFMRLAPSTNANLSMPGSNLNHCPLRLSNPNERTYQTHIGIANRREFDTNFCDLRMVSFKTQ